MNTSPTFSICIPVYNRERFIQKTIQSVLEQTYQDFEIIIFDNCSTDNTVKIIHQFNDRRIKFFQNEKNIGMTPNWNNALRVAKGKYVKLLMSDDFLTSDSLETHVKIFNKYKNVVLNSGSRIVVDENEVIIGKSQSFKRGKYYNGKSAQKWLIRFSNSLVGLPSACAFRKDASIKAGEFISHLENSMIPNSGWAYDWEYWLRLLKYGDFYFTNHVVAAIRIHPDTGTSQINKNLINRLDHYFKLMNYVYLYNEHNFSNYDYIIGKLFRVRQVYGKLKDKTELKKILKDNNIYYLFYFYWVLIKIYYLPKKIFKKLFSVRVIV